MGRNAREQGGKALMGITPIRSDVQYRQARSRIADLIRQSGQAAEDELVVLAVLADDFERRHHAVALPTPLAAIRFRMQQAGLKPRDLEPFIGSRARVSEVLSGTRTLSLDMIRALHKHLGIPASALIAQEDKEAIAKPQSPSQAAIQKLQSLGLMKLKESFAAYLRRMLGPEEATALLRKSRTERTNAKTDQAALTAWLAGVRYLADNIEIDKPKRRTRGPEAARKLARLSTASDGPLRARAQLRQWGIILITLEHLPGTYLDGAAMCRSDGVPVIAMTLRHDRIDNFWFTLIHEFCHVSEHLDETTTLILDDLELKSADDIEGEADRFAQEALIPAALWDAVASADMSSEQLAAAAAAAGVHRAIVAGRWQREYGDYRRFSKLLGRGEVRAQFS